MISREFVLAGEAILTVENPAGDHYTYQVLRSEASEQYDECFFVRLLTGPDNTRDYSYIGMLDPKTGEVRRTAKSKLPDDAVPIRVIRWALRIVWRGGDLPEGYKIRHDGRCGKCGRRLTTPTALTLGIGPECARTIKRAAAGDTANGSGKTV